jgi:DNA-binding transcriptional LysR family regulator
MKIDQMEAFVALAEERHFGRAAARLSVTTSSLSKRIRELERSVGVRLFDRTSRSVAPTPAAKLLLDQARVLVAEARRFRSLAAEAAGGSAGHLRLVYAANHFDFVAGILRAVRQRHPDIRLDHVQKPNPEVAPAVVAGEASLGACWGDVPPGLDRYCFDILVLDTVFVPERHRLAGHDSVDVADLDGETFVLTGPDPAELWRDRGVTIDVRRLPIGGRDELATRVETGDGLVLTSSRAVPRYRHRAVVPVALSEPSAWGHLPQHLVWRHDDDSPALRQVVTISRQVAGATT